MSKSQQRVALIASHLTSSHNNATRKLTTATTTTTTAAAVKPAYRNRNDYKYFLPIQTRYVHKLSNTHSGSLLKAKQSM